MACFIFDLLRFDIFFKEPQNDMARALLGIIGVKVSACLNRIIFLHYVHLLPGLIFMVEETDC